MEPYASLFNNAKTWQEREKILNELLESHAEEIDQLGGLSQEELNFLAYTARGKTKVRGVANAIAEYNNTHQE